jgi:DNA repair ATPase RecN
MYDDRADNIEQALTGATDLLESLAEIAQVDDEYGSQISQLLDDIKYAQAELDDLDTDFDRAQEDQGYEDRAGELEDATSTAAYDLDSVVDDLKSIIRDLEWA